jgi:hypothetical protein
LASGSHFCFAEQSKDGAEARKDREQDETKDEYAAVVLYPSTQLDAIGVAAPHQSEGKYQVDGCTQTPRTNVSGLSMTPAAVIADSRPRILR